MKKIYILFILLFVVSQANAQDFIQSGPRTIFNLHANKGAGKYTFFNFDQGKEMAATDSSTASWDIAFSSTNIILNGGTSGPSSTTGQVLTGTSFLTQTTAPASGYTADGTSKAIITGSGNGWYIYNYVPADGGPHTITPIQDRLIAVKLSDGRYVKIQMLNYYQGAPLQVPVTGAPYSGVSGYYSFRYTISPAGTTDWSQMLTKITNLDAVSVYNFFNLASADTLLLTDSASTKWDIAFKSTTILTNSGTSGPGQDSAQVIAADFDTYAQTSSSGWKADGASGKAIMTGSGNGWYNYDGASNIITPLPGRIITVKTSSGRYAKIRIESYYKDNITSGTSRYYTLSYYFQPDGSTSFYTSSATTTGIDEAAVSNHTLNLYPNPVSASEQTLRTNPLSSGIARVYDIQGNNVYETDLSLSNGILTVMNLKSGIYFISIEESGKKYQQKLIVE